MADGESGVGAGEVKMPECGVCDAGEYDLPPEGWERARVAFLGDSITDPGQTNSQHVYWQYLAKWFDWDARVYGISGHRWLHIPGQTDRAIAEMGDDVDALH